MRMGNIPSTIQNIPGVLRDSGLGQTNLWSDLMNTVSNMYATRTAAQVSSAQAQAAAAQAVAAQRPIAPAIASGAMNYTPILLLGGAAFVAVMLMRRRGR